MISKAGKYYLSDLQWYISRTYPNARYSGLYVMIKDSFKDFKVPEEEFDTLMSLSILNGVKNDLQLKKQKIGTDDPRRMYEAVHCLVLIDMVAQHG